AVDALRDEFLILPTVLEDVPEHPVDHRNVGAGPDPHEFGRVRRGTSEPRVADNEIRAVELLALEQMLQRDRGGLGRIAAQEEQRLGIADVVEAVGHRAVAPGIGYAGDRGRMADARLVIGIVGPPEGAELAEEIRALIGEFRRAKPIDRIGTGAPANCGELVADLIDRLVPGDASPLAVHELHRVAQAPIPMHQLAHRGPLGAVRAAIDRRLPAWLLADPHAVGDFGGHRAADGAVRTDAFADGDLRAGSRRRAGLRLAHACERQRAYRGETSGNEPRAPQKRSAVETAIRHALQRAREHAAPALTFRPPDQHGCLLSPDNG